jgi:DNA-binding transcriptional LysR family regulator
MLGPVDRSGTSTRVRQPGRHPPHPLTSSGRYQQQSTTTFNEGSYKLQISRSDMPDLAHFLAVARRRSFRQAGLDLGVSGSALSHSLKTLEARIGVRLLNRTTRSVTLTAAGEHLYAAISEPIDTLGQALEALNRFRDRPAGRIRLNVPHDAAIHLLTPVIPTYVERYPDLELEVAVSNHMVDVTDGGYDAGIRFGGTVPEDMIARRLSSGIRWVVVGSPAYLDRHGIPRHPDDLMHHQCLRIRDGAGRMYEWELERDGQTRTVSVPGAMIIDETRFAIGLVEKGVGLAYAPKLAVEEGIAQGSLRQVLEHWSSTGPGYYLYYSSKRQLPMGLKVLIELIRELRPLGY